MAVYAYQGTSLDGQKRTGELEAGSRSEALRKLASDRIQPLTLVAKADMAEYDFIPLKKQLTPDWLGAPGGTGGGLRSG